jgi:hypothetical protein
VTTASPAFKSSPRHRRRSSGVSCSPTSPPPWMPRMTTRISPRTPRWRLSGSSATATAYSRPSWRPCPPPRPSGASRPRQRLAARRGSTMLAWASRCSAPSPTISATGSGLRRLRPARTCCVAFPRPSWRTHAWWHPCAAASPNRTSTTTPQASPMGAARTSRPCARCARRCGGQRHPGAAAP